MKRQPVRESFSHLSGGVARTVTAPFPLGSKSVGVRDFRRGSQNPGAPPPGPEGEQKSNNPRRNGVAWTPLTILVRRCCKKVAMPTLSALLHSADIGATMDDLLRHLHVRVKPQTNSFTCTHQDDARISSLGKKRFALESFSSIVIPWLRLQRSMPLVGLKEGNRCLPSISQPRTDRHTRNRLSSAPAVEPAAFTEPEWTTKTVAPSHRTCNGYCRGCVVLCKTE